MSVSIGNALRRTWRVWAGIAVALVALASVGGVAALRGSDQGRPAGTAAAGVTTVAGAGAGAGAVAVAGAVAGATAGATTAAAGATSAATGAAGGSPAAASNTGAGDTPRARSARGGPLLLWPFSTEQQALDWQRSNREGGHQPWHVDPCGTGQSFVQSVLGFSDVTEVASCEIHGDDAWVTVGYAGEGRVNAAGATIHLVRLGNDPGGWTVVGSRDRATLTLVAPRYGAEVGEVVHLAGEVSGLGEDILTVRILDRSGRTLGEAPRRMIGLGGAWQADIRPSGVTDEVLIAVASTDSGLGSLGDLAITALVVDGRAGA